MNTITDDQGNVYNLVHYSTLEEDSEGYQYTKDHGYILVPTKDVPKKDLL